MRDFQLVPEQQMRIGLRRSRLNTPLTYEQTVYWPVSVGAARDQLIARLGDTFTVDGGMRYLGRTGVRYHDLQQYTGVVDGNFFNLAGPFGVNTIPLVIEGELYAQGETSLVHLSVRTPTGNMWRSALAILVVGIFYAALLHFWLIIPAVLVGMLFTYLGAAAVVHRQVKLLVEQLLETQ